MRSTLSLLQNYRSESENSDSIRGNQQKVCIGLWQVDELKVLILEEPARAVDLVVRKVINCYSIELSGKGLMENAVSL